MPKTRGTKGLSKINTEEKSMSNSENETGYARVLKLLGIIMGILVATITIFIFVTGNTYLPDFLRKHSSGSTGALIDNFDNPSYDGIFNPNVWKSFNGENAKIYQSDGKLIIWVEQKTPGGAGLTPSTYSQLILTTPISIEAKMMVEQPQDGHAFILIGSDNIDEYSDCVFGWQAINIAQLGCNYMVNTGKRNGYSTNKTMVDYGTWHILRLEIRPESMEYKYFIDENEIDTYTPPNEDELRKSNFSIQIGCGNNISPSEPYLCYFDYVKINPLEP